MTQSNTFDRVFGIFIMAMMGTMITVMNEHPSMVIVACMCAVGILIELQALDRK